MWSARTTQAKRKRQKTRAKKEEEKKKNSDSNPPKCATDMFWSMANVRLPPEMYRAKVSYQCAIEIWWLSGSISNEATAEKGKKYTTRIYTSRCSALARTKTTKSDHIYVLDVFDDGDERQRGTQAKAAGRCDPVVDVLLWAAHNIKTKRLITEP